MTDITVDEEIDEFITRWASSGGAERANFQLFASQLCRLIGVAEPHPANVDGTFNDYTFERNVEFKEADGTKSKGRIDLYKRNCFVMEAKQSREKGRPKALELPGQPDFFVPDYTPRGQRSANRAWDQLMIGARRQAQEYARALPNDHGWPPIVLVCDVGHCIEVYADFSGQGKNYAQYPDRQGFRVYLQDLKDPAARERLKLIWTRPRDLDPARQSAKVTREIAARLAEVSKGLERRGHRANAVADFLMRCLFTMFAEDVELLPKDSFKALLEKCVGDPSKFEKMVEQLWEAMDTGSFAFAIELKVKKFNGKLFKDRTVLPLERQEIGELVAAAKYNWKEVEPAIFGTLLEQALDADERSRLGAHYTPRAYVERLVVVTMVEPLRQEWAQVQATAERLKEEERPDDAIAAVSSFHAKLCNTRVLDPACGTGNFLYVALELMKRLEGEVLEALADLGGQEGLGLDKATVDPHQFIGLELNPRAAAIAELVIWLGYLQWHFRTKAIAPAEPILRDFKNITVMDAVLTWDGDSFPRSEPVQPGASPRRPDWPSADFIIGNPPFIGGKDVRATLGDAYSNTLWQVHDHINDSADYVMYWWDKAAEIVAKGSAQRFGLVTTNSITQVFSRRVVARHLEAKRPVSLLMAIPDHPWTKATPHSAAVRIAMTVAAAGRHEGALRKVVREGKLDTDQPEIELSAKAGRINADLSVGVDVTAAEVLRANEGLSSPGVKLHGAGFIVTPAEAELLGLGKRAGLEQHIRPYRHGRDLTARPRGVMVIDMHGLDADDVRQRFPEVYQHLLATVKAGRQTQFGKSPTRDAQEYLNRWWTFGKPREELRPALAGLQRYIVTVETSKHRVFLFLNDAIVPDNRLVCFALDDAFCLGILSSRSHVVWALMSGGTLEDRPIYTKSVCFDRYPFPDCGDGLKARIRAIAEDLDAHRKARQAEAPGLTLTQMYNVLEKLKSGEPLTDEDERIQTDGLVLILKELHERLDAAVFEAYGLGPSSSDNDILERLVALNKRHSIEEKAGAVRWLRPDYQIPRFGSDAEKARLEEESRRAKAEARMTQGQGALLFEDDLREMKQRFPTGEELAETVAVMRVLEAAGEAMAVEQIARHFSQGKQIEKRVERIVLALARLGHLSSPDEGRSFVLRRAA